MHLIPGFMCALLHVTINHFCRLKLDGGEETSTHTWDSLSVFCKKDKLKHVKVFVTSEYIHPYILCIVPRCLFQDVSVMYLSHVIPQCLF